MDGEEILRSYYTVSYILNESTIFISLSTAISIFHPPQQTSFETIESVSTQQRILYCCVSLTNLLYSSTVVEHAIITPYYPSYSTESIHCNWYRQTIHFTWQIRYPYTILQQITVFIMIIVCSQYLCYP